MDRRRNCSLSVVTTNVFILATFFSHLTAVAGWVNTPHTFTLPPSLAMQVHKRTGSHVLVSTTIFLVTVFGTPNFLPNNQGTVAHAACLSGDLSPSCIGVYKVPMDDRILPYVNTPEALSKFAPDLNYVPPIQSPDSVSQALEILATQQLAAQDIANVVSAGKLEEAGIKILNLLTTSQSTTPTLPTTPTTSEPTTPSPGGGRDATIALWVTLVPGSIILVICIGLFLWKRSNRPL